MVKIRLYSDLHREFQPWDIPALKDRKKEKNYVLVLAGDIAVSRRSSTYVDFLLDAADRHRAVVYIPGNHEYYGSSFDRAWDDMKSYFDGVPNLHMLNGESVVIDDVLFIGATLWTDFDKGNELAMFMAGQYMNDYQVITRLSESDTDDGWAYRGKLTPAHTMAMHNQHRAFIDQELAKQGEGQKSLVVTHHGPTRQSVAEHYQGSSLNPAYVSDLSNLIRERAPTAWVHGHTHHSAKYWESKTLVMTNPKGYPEQGWRKAGESAHENPNFREDGTMPELNSLFE
jgi:predicted phosphodiesterase